MENYLCEVESCGNIGKLKCAKCKELRLSDCFGRYCGSDCQKLHFPNHKTFHKINKDPRKTLQQYVGWTALLGMKELQARSQLPSLSPEKSFSLHLFGCRMDPEGFTEQYTILFDSLKNTMFPEIEKLMVTVSGFELIVPTKNKVVSLLNGAVIISFLKGRCETIAPTLDFRHGVAMTNNPGLSQNYDSWEPGMKVLMELGATTISTGFTAQFQTIDYAFEERTMATYFGAKIVVPSTYNPAQLRFWETHTDAYLTGGCTKSWGAKAGFYFAFCGRDSAITPISKQQFLKENQIAYLSDRTLEYDNEIGSSPHPLMAEYCRRLVRAIVSGNSWLAADADIFAMIKHLHTRCRQMEELEAEPKYREMLNYYGKNGIWSRALWGLC